MKCAHSGLFPSSNRFSVFTLFHFALSQHPPFVLFSSVHYFSRLQSTMFATYMLYFGYMAIISLGMFLMCGCIGLFSCLWFCRKMFGSIKVD